MKTKFLKSPSLQISFLCTTPSLKSATPVVWLPMSPFWPKLSVLLNFTVRYFCGYNILLSYGPYFKCIIPIFEEQHIIETWQWNLKSSKIGKRWGYYLPDNFSPLPELQGYISWDSRGMLPFCLKSKVIWLKRKTKIWKGKVRGYRENWTQI